MNIHDTKVFINNFGHTLTAYQCKKNINVKILCSYHRRVDMLDNPKKRPESVFFYNSTQFGVDSLDLKARLYSTKAGSRLWKIHVFLAFWIWHVQIPGSCSRK